MFDSAERLAGIFPGEIANHTDFSLNAWPEVAFASAKKSGIMVSAFIAEAFPGPLVPVAKRTGARGAELLLPVSAMRYKEYNNFQADAIAAF